MALRCILTKRNVDDAQLLIQAQSGMASVEVAGRAPTTSEVAIQLEIQKAGRKDVIFFLSKENIYFRYIFHKMTDKI